MTVCARMRRDLGLALLSLMSVAVECNGMSPPGKPVLLGCRSPEKETFTCWWEPGSDGGLLTTHRLYYEKENVEGIHECPDYRSAGRNSCFFDKSRTSIWVEYNLMVVASNALGNATSEPLSIDVMEIVKPNTPENVTLLVEERENSPCLSVRWEPPRNTDTKSGWVTIKYELRVKQQNSDEWKEYASGTQAYFSLYNVNPGVVYMIQVRCRLDHGSWSDWTNSTHAKIPNYLQNEKLVWILVSILSAISFITAMCILVMKRKHVQQCLLPRVPVPKIRGVDVQLLKSGRAEDVVSALIFNQNFPSMGPCVEPIEEYLIVSDNYDVPPSSQKRKKSLINRAGIHTDLEIQSTSGQCNGVMAKESNDERDNFEKSNKSLSEDTISNMEPDQLPTQKPQCSNINLINTGTMHPPNHNSVAERIVYPLANSSYVDIQRHENIQEVDMDYNKVKEVNGDNIFIAVKENMEAEEKNIPKDYSRVTEVESDNAVILHIQNISADSSDSCSKEKRNHNTDWTDQKPRNPHVTRPSTGGVCIQLTGSGYVETIPVPPLM
nr:prolactin receptor-like isoform X2 [Monopterus albus]